MRARTLARHLVAQGHAVTMAASGRAVGILRRNGLDVVAIDGMAMRYERGAVLRGRTIAELVRTAPRALTRNARAALALDFVPDAVVTDFDTFSCAIGRLLGKPVISVDHQHVFDRFLHPEPVARRVSSRALARRVVSAKTRCDAYVVSSFFFPPERARNRTPTFLVGPILRPEIERAAPWQGEHVLVYQTAAGDPNLLAALGRVKRARFVVYGLGAGAAAANVELRGFDEGAFVRDLTGARAVIANGGFTTLSEAIALGKPVLSVPLRGQPEQELNAAWVEALGVGACARAVSSPVVEDVIERLPTFRPAGDARIRTGTRDACAALDLLLSRATTEAA
jgi:uncharacterized protein (TIGR00661 family)